MADHAEGRRHHVKTNHDGIVRIAVLEARCGQIILNNQSLVDDQVLNRILANLKGSQIKQSRLDRDLLLLSDLPGVTVSADLKPGDHGQ